LLEEGLLTSEDFSDMPAWPDRQVDFGALYHWKPALLEKAYTRLETMPNASLRTKFSAFRLTNASWLEDFALFMALKEANGGTSWNAWPTPLRMRQPEALDEARTLLASRISAVAFSQFLFFHQWEALRDYAHEKGITIIGDIPIFAAMDSADVWSHPELFFLNKKGKPTVVAGVPPDYFSPTGQLWGNPLYRWSEHKKSGYAWWIARVHATLNLVDVVRIDHFRGFAGYWEIPGNASTAEKGRWVTGPRANLFNAIRKSLGDIPSSETLPIIAEDLGVITPDVVELRDSFGLPGMKVLQFAFSGPDNVFLPHHYVPNYIVYTGTHDNDTTLGWYASAPPEEQKFARRYLNVDGSDFAWDLIRAAWRSVAVFALAPLQDFLSLGPEARMNFPGRLGGNWTWRMREEDLTDALRDGIRDFNRLYAR
jgi:4-alpha-glucanotransferase